jgi:hypothetical protein
MNVLVDTCVWSAVLRRKRPLRKLTAMLEKLIREGRVTLIGPIRQEILSGISDPRQFERLRSKLSAFPDLLLEETHFETAARFCNTCRSKGVQGSLVDFLICAVVHLEHIPILTTDEDFKRYQKYLDIDIVDVD